MVDLNAISNWASLLGRNDVLILDTETTGFQKDSEVIQVSMINTNGQTRFNNYVLPKNEIPAESTKIHGLTRSKLKNMNAKPWNLLHQSFFALTNQVAFVLVYNLDFDERLIRQSCNIRGVPFEPFNGRCILKEYAQYRQVFNQWQNGWKWHKLSDAARKEGAIQQKDVHDSLEDCQVVLSLMQNVVKTNYR